MEELLLDYEDYLRHRHLPMWTADSTEASAVRSVPRRFREDRINRSDKTDPSDLTDISDRQRWSLYSQWLDHNEPTVRANAIICVIHQCNYLLDQQIAALEIQFVTEGGYSEQLAAARLVERAKQRDQTDRSDQSNPTDLIPNCPQCGKAMALRTAKQGQNAGQQFWGCTGYPDCKGTANV